MTDEQKNIEAMEVIKDGTFDNRRTNTRQVFWNGILAYDIPHYAIPIMRDRFGNKVKMSDFGTFPNFPFDHLPDATEMMPSKDALQTQKETK